jgi:NAD(P)H-hydrate repair Nnr-like enzyme with NAD(P)H-hydrate epimerase domain
MHEQITLKSHYISSVEMKALDEYAIREKGVPSMVLMERAALAVFRAGMRALNVIGLPWARVEKALRTF